MTSTSHNPPILNTLFAQCMQHLEHTALHHFPRECILAHQVPHAKSPAFLKMVRGIEHERAEGANGKNGEGEGGESGGDSGDNAAGTAGNTRSYSGSLRDLYTQRFIASRLSGSLKQRGELLCPCCWLTVSECVCSTMCLPREQHPMAVARRELSDDTVGAVPGEGVRYRFIVYMHHHELLRSTNSAKLLLSHVPDTDLIVAGLAEQEKRLEDQYLCKSNTLILFPGKDAITFDEYFQKQMHDGAEGKEEEEKETKDGGGGASGRTLNIIVLDGTWANARCLARRIPQHVQRVKLKTIENYVTIFNEIRKMSSARQAVSRVSTLEAATLAMRELGQSEELIDTLHSNLKRMINTVKRLNARPLVQEWLVEEKEKERSAPANDEPGEMKEY